MLGLAEPRAFRATVTSILAGAVCIVLAGVLVQPAFAALAALLVIAALTIWRARGLPVPMDFYAHGFRDGRWGDVGHIGWADILKLESDSRSEILDLELSDELAGELLGNENGLECIIVRKEGRVCYRLKLGAAYADVVDRIRAFTGLEVHAP